MRPGKQGAWVTFMEKKIILFQVWKGMAILGSFVGDEDPKAYVWIRRIAKRAPDDQECWWKLT
jgi:hypothetical protein